MAALKKGKEVADAEVENSGVAAIDIHASVDIPTKHTIEYVTGMTKQ